ncbi:MAG: hypothetical protein RAK18_05490 [Conexivisphaerales archaeon]|nr:hypothetical protein [Conexivisphaerales archaeon]
MFSAWGRMAQDGSGDEEDGVMATLSVDFERNESTPALKSGDREAGETEVELRAKRVGDEKDGVV